MEDRQQQQPPRPRISTSAAIASGIAVVALVAGGGTGIWAWQTLTSSEPPPAPAVDASPSEPDASTAGSTAAPEPTASPDTEGDSEAAAAAPNNAPEAPQQTAANAPAMQPQAYWLSASGESVELVPTAMELNAKTQADPEAALEVTLERLLSGPRDDATASAIPDGTRLRNVSIRDDGIHLDLSSDFTTGGGTLSMTGRVAQVLHTATSLNPEAPLWLNIEGEPLEVLGGEGLILDRPLTRKGFANDFAL